MSLASGTRLGAYEIVAALGAGGMGEVYKARDTRLERTVAIKVLPPGFATDREHRVRFEREAKTVAALNHPHICTLHDVGRDVPTGQAEGGGRGTDRPAVDYLVMEHLAGETLAARLSRGPLPLEQALTIAIAIADALAAAHRQGVIHRDVKPGNVMLATSGASARSGVQPKLLDFGLAKLKMPAAATAATTTAMPAHEPVTGLGMVVGTVPYMAPEQLEGREVDARSDIFAFGAVLYEMLTGRRAFDGESQASVIAAVLEHDPPPLSAVQPITPPALERLVRKCLHKDPDARWQTAADAADELRWVASGSSAVSAVASAQRALPARRRWVMPAVLAGTVLVGAGGGALIWRAVADARVSAPQVVRLQLSVADAGLAPPVSPALSPDGKVLAFVAGEGDGGKLYVKKLHETTVKALEDTVGAYNPVFSPDGASIAFVDAKALRIVPVTGGPPALVLEGKEIHSRVTWTEDGYIVFCYKSKGGVWRMRATGGEAEPVVPPDPKRPELRYRFPHVLPGGGAVIYTMFPNGKQEEAAVLAAPVKGGAPTILVSSGADGRYLPGTGHLVYLSEGHLFAAGFDPRQLKRTTEPVAVERDVSFPDFARLVPAGVRVTYDVSPNGTLVYAPPPTRVLAWRDRRGRDIPFNLNIPGRLAAVALSPKADRVVLTIGTGSGTHLFSVNPDNGDALLTPVLGGGSGAFGAFTCDGRRMLFTARDDRGVHNVFSVGLDTGAKPEGQTRSPNNLAPTSVTCGPGGELFLFNNVTKRGEDYDVDIWVQQLDRPETARALISTSAKEWGGVFSPDGRWIAYASDASPKRSKEIYVRGYPDGPTTAITDGGADYPVWNPRGNELFYQNAGAVFSVPVVNGRRTGPPKKLFAGMGETRGWDVAPGGERFLVVGSAQPPYLHVVLNWAEVLKAKAARR